MFSSQYHTGYKETKWFEIKVFCNIYFFTNLNWNHIWQRFRWTDLDPNSWQYPLIMYLVPIKASTLFLREWTLPESLCQYFSLIFFSNLFVSVLTCAFICLNRAIAIWNYKLAEFLFTWKYTIVYYILMWSFSICLMLLPMNRIWGEIGMKKELFICTIKATEKGNPR